jgi:predicted metal-binding protein
MAKGRVLGIKKRKELEALFHEHGISDFKWIDPKDIVVSQWVRMKCAFGCGEYGHNATCPPNTPSVAECERFFKEYSDAAILRFEKKVKKPEDRHAWSRGVNLKLSKLERDVFLSGFEKTFLLFMDSCCLCAECAGERGKCKVPKMARPSPESMAVDVYSTVKKYGFPIEPLTDYAQAMNRYAFLMVV